MIQIDIPIWVQLGMNQGGVSKALNQFQNDEHVKDTTNHTKIMDYKNIFNQCKNSEMILKIYN